MQAQTIKTCPKCGKEMVEMTVSDSVYTEDMMGNEVLAGWYDAMVCPDDGTETDQHWIPYTYSK